ncbi:alpha-xylosidase [Echinicola jeungdonensis]|uniref:Alpha-xylosidase n=1 Tax=Echinicola jeungdonensis TaxID=709343 RepID=A0ABV5J512_9BACT|nr:alpha-xylosidase [Echinicola jeungdonensis]MDN3669546.1 alpha-xylosidase [Echinicola jeungdonensis]
MKQTNYQLFDFLDFNPELDSETNKARLWRACKPTSIAQRGKEVVVTIPFQLFKYESADLSADTSAEQKVFELNLRAYGNKILRVGAAFSGEIKEKSPMLEMNQALKQTGLSIEKQSKKWLVKDEGGRLKAEFDLSDPETDHWSDLLPAPEETFKAIFFPDGEKAIKLSAYDQFFPARADAMGLAFVEEKSEIDRVSFSFHAKPDEKFVGTGERFAKMDLSGHTFQLKNQDGQGVNNRRTYKNIPFYLSSEMYGLFLHTSAYSKFSLADHSNRSVQMLVEEPLMDVFLIGGDQPEEILFQYRQLTGFPSLPPLWSFGVWMSRMTYFSAEEVEEICDRLRAEDYPCDVIHLDTGWFRTDWLCEWKFNPERFPDPKGFIQKLKKQGYRVSLWQMPYIAAEAEQHDEAKANKYMGPLNEKKMQSGSNFSALDYAGTIDFTYPAAVEWYKNLLRELLEMGITCIKTDFGEEIHLDAQYHDMAPELLNNLYGLLYQKAAYEVTKEVTGDGIVWARAGWAGCQRYPLHWGGDAAASWDGMAGSLKGGLHLGLSGFGFWSHDVPGFHGVPNFMNSVIPDDLYIRWTQFGVFTSHIRYHGTSKREPYHFPNISGMVRKWWKLRYALLPYILEQSEKATQSGFPVLRALLLHHPKDKMCWHIDDQYYFGEDILVAPVMNSENRRDIYLPEGNWVSLFSGEKIKGGRWLNQVEVPLEEMPVWVKESAVIPLYPEAVSCTDEMDLAKTVKVSVDENFKGIWPFVEKLERQKVN